MEIPGMIEKWSSRPKRDNAQRIRENQRRHRARNKAHVADLESELADVRRRLDDALAENSVLLTELNRFRTGCACGIGQDTASSRDPGLPNDSIHDHNGHANPALPTTVQDGSTDYSGTIVAQPPPALSCPTSIPTPMVLSCSPCPPLAATTCFGTSCPVILPVASDQAETDVLPSQEIDMGDCPHLPPPAPGESTIHCRTAFRIIEQQNYAGQDLSRVERLLAPGFRRAIAPGDGCRVESSRVFSLIDAINNS